MEDLSSYNKEKNQDKINQGIQTLKRFPIFTLREKARIIRNSITGG